MEVMKNRVNVLGTEYLIIKKDLDEYGAENNFGAHCNSIDPIITIYNMKTYPGWEDEPNEICLKKEKRNLRHEIIHAFLFESGLGDNSNPNESWATNEEMVDWIALQGPKIYKAWEEAGAL